jgi:hypothetical protein
MKRTIISAAIAGSVVAALGAAGAQTLHTEKFPYKSGPVTITGCSFAQSGSSGIVDPNSLHVKFYQNEQARALTSVTFRIRYAGTPLTITDNGEFTYQAPIDRNYTIHPPQGLPWQGPDPQVCRVLTATFANGETVRPMADEWMRDQGDADADRGSDMRDGGMHHDDANGANSGPGNSMNGGAMNGTVAPTPQPTAS